MGLGNNRDFSQPAHNYRHFSPSRTQTFTITRVSHAGGRNNWARGGPV
jgi:hypothetical protein